MPDNFFLFQTQSTYDGFEYTLQPVSAGVPPKATVMQHFDIVAYQVRMFAEFRMMSEHGEGTSPSRIQDVII